MAVREVGVIHATANRMGMVSSTALGATNRRRHVTPPLFDSVTVLRRSMKKRQWGAGEAETARAAINAQPIPQGRVRPEYAHGAPTRPKQASGGREATPGQSMKLNTHAPVCPDDGEPHVAAQRARGDRVDGVVVAVAARVLRVKIRPGRTATAFRKQNRRGQRWTDDSC